MAKKKEEVRLGSDPLKWIQDSREESNASKSSSIENTSKQDKPALSKNKEKSSMPTKSSNTSNKSKPSKSNNQELPENNDKPIMPSKPELPEKSNGVSLPENIIADWTRATFVIREKHLEGLKAVAYWDRKLIKEVLDEALEMYLAGKKTEPIPKGRRF